MRRPQNQAGILCVPFVWAAPAKDFTWFSPLLHVALSHPLLSFNHLQISVFPYHWHAVRLPIVFSVATSGLNFILQVQHPASYLSLCHVVKLSSLSLSDSPIASAGSIDINSPLPYTTCSINLSDYLLASVLLYLSQSILPFLCIISL